MRSHAGWFLKGQKNANKFKVRVCQVTTLKELNETLDEYLESAAYILTHINPNIIIHKISGDAPKDLLLAPEWNSHKKWIMNGLDKLLKEKDLYQGMYYKQN